MAYVIRGTVHWNERHCLCGRLSVDCIHPKKDEGNFAAAEMPYIAPVECIDAAPASRCAPYRRFLRSTTCRKNGRSLPPKTPAYYGKIGAAAVSVSQSLTQPQRTALFGPQPRAHFA